ncbi:transcriptional regulator, HxlR family [Maridesulfovibrio ferrireducens]|uniref:Transcriptional regulator, HxlR family n=1 Tax=Maridesulfovibrio ferrireducens TaxID=246191 RepID=A0A1G9I749_9BACT|nr:helix-turn-helix domain-containing protein [Maridesulfovibrio ferrireducens]SDL21090.1 transcriptional regulator, HxlR family [Maridesulfovibrio ferrireducens]
MTCSMKDLNGKEYKCFFELTLLVIGGKWKPIILYFLFREKVLRFGELRKRIPEVTERMLTKQLRELESDGLVHREVYKVVPPKVEYTLTPIGERLIPVLESMREWGVEYEEFLYDGEVLKGEGYEKK